LNVQDYEKIIKLTQLVQKEFDWENKVKGVAEREYKTE